MLSKQDNDLLCRVGPGTPMGDLFRQYWLPAIRSDELPGPDCPPLRLMLLGEPLIAFRTTSGSVGIMQNSCPHRGASMFFDATRKRGCAASTTAGSSCRRQLRRHAFREAGSNFRAGTRAPTRRTSVASSGLHGPARGPPLCPDMEANLINRGPGHQSYKAQMQLDAGPRGARHDRRPPALGHRQSRGPGPGQLPLLSLQPTQQRPLRLEGHGVRRCVRLPRPAGATATTGAQAW